VLVQAHERRYGPSGAAEFSPAVPPEEQTCVSSSSALVEIHALGLQVRKLRDSLRVQSLEILSGGRDRSSALGHGSLRLAQPLDLDLSVDLKCPKVAKQGAGLAD
jgi:hypothetical protein